MKNILVMSLFILAMLAWAAAQQPVVPRSGAVGRLLPRVRRRRAQLKLNHRSPPALTRPGPGGRSRLSRRAAWVAAPRTTGSRTEWHHLQTEYASERRYV